MSYAESRKQILHNLRSKLIAERKFYARYKGELEVYHPNEWAIVSEVIKTIASYFHSEIVRCKHDTANWMNGFDVSDDYGDELAVEMIHGYVSELPGLLDTSGNAAQKYERVKADPIVAASAKMEHDKTVKLIEASIEEIKKAAKRLEDVSYGER